MSNLLMRSGLRPILFCFALSGNIAFADSEPDPWLVRQIDNLVATARAACQEKSAIPAYEKLLGQLARTIEQKRSTHDEKFLNRFPRFVDFVETASLDLKPDHKLGFNVSDKQYFAETKKYVQIPDFLLNQNFVRWASRSETLEKAKAYLVLLNLTRAPSDQLLFFSYQSRHLGTPDNNDSLRRLLIIVPGDPESEIPEKWVQFGITDPEEKKLTRNVSVVTALPKPDGTFEAYFKDYYRTYRPNEPIQIKGRWELGYGDDNCVRCHKSGVLPIFPVGGSVIASEQQAVREANKRFRSYGSPRFGKYLDETKLGPGLAAADPASRRQRFGEEFAQTAIGDAMICARCHQNDGLGALNWPLSPKVIGSFVKGGQMPRDHNLSERDRRELYQKLIQEYFATDNANPGILKSWLLGVGNSEQRLAGKDPALLPK